MYDYCNLYKRKERYLVCDHTGMEPNFQRQIQSLQSILHNEEIQDKEIASVSYRILNEICLKNQLVIC